MHDDLLATRLGPLAGVGPRALLVEGGTASGRERAALYWAALLNCAGPGAPCGQCRECVQVREKVFTDLKFLDGSADFIKIGDVRELRPLWGQPPRGSGKRVTVFFEAQNLTGEAANALLKSLEEPGAGNVFVLTCPQRERLLPTLVSRSWVVTLAWPRAGGAEGASAELLEAMLGFWETGRGWFGRTLERSSVGRDDVFGLVSGLRRDLALAMAGEASGGGAGRLADLFDAGGRRRLGLALASAQEALNANVAPALVADWVATRMLGRSRRTG